MAISNTKGPFNPDTADVSPGNYLGLSKPLDNFNLSSVLGEALKGTGTLIEESVKSADILLKASVVKDVNEKVIPEREAFTDALKGATAYVKNVGIQPNIATDAINEGGSPEGMPIQAADAPESLIAPERELPINLKELPDRLDAVHSARNNGKISDTDYDGRMAAIAKDIRAKYPVAYRDYIDSEISKVTGVDPANAYIKGMISDINSFMTNKDHERNASLADMRHAAVKGIAGADENWKAVLNGTKSIQDGISWVNKANANEYALDQTKKRIEYTEGNIKLATVTKTMDAGELFSGIANKHYHSLDALPGMSKSMKDINDYIVKIQSNQLEADPVQMKQLAQIVMAYRNRASTEMDAEEYRLKLSGIVDQKVLNEKKAAALLPWDTMAKALDSGDMALAGFAKGLVQAGIDSIDSSMFKDKDIGPTLSALTVIKNRFGETGAAQLMVRTVSEGPFLGNISAFVTKAKIDIANPESATTWKSSLQEMKAAEKKAGIENKFPENYRTLVGMVMDRDGYSLLNPKLSKEAKETLVMKFFSEANRGALRLIKPDSYDPKTGKVTAGYESVFSGFTQQAVVEEIGKLSPAAQSMYLDWVRTSVREDLYRVSISKFKDMSLSAEGVWAINWDTSKHNLEVIKTRSATFDTEPYYGRVPQSRGGPTPIGIVEQGIKSVNKALTGMANVARGFGHEGIQVDEFVLQELIDAGVGADRLAGIPGVPNSIAEAIATTYKKQKLKNKEMQLKEEENLKKFGGR